MNKEIQFYATGICYTSACVPSEISRKEIEEQANKQLPTGIDSQWKISEKNFQSGETNPCTCNDYKDRLHYLLSC